MRVFLTLLLVVGICTITDAQKIRLTKVEQDGDRVLIWYDLEGIHENQLFDISLYSSFDGFNNPLKFISGDAGKNIRPGVGKKITWNALSELQRFDGNVEFKVSATIQYTPLTDLTVIGSPRIKRGEFYEIIWQGGDPDAKLNMILYKGKILSYRIPGIENTGKYIWDVPAKIKPGSSYRFTLSETGETNSGTASETFGIKRKFPIGAIIIPAAVVAGGAVYFIMNGSDEGGNTDPIDPVNNDLPNPPDKPDFGG